MSDEGKWFQTGFKVAQDLNKEREDRRNQTGDLRRFWVGIGADKARDIIFLDNFKLKMEREGRECDAVPFVVWEHQLEVDGDWQDKKHITCVGPNNGCLCCEKKLKKTCVGILSVLDVTSFQDKQTGQKIVKPEKKLFAGTPNALVMLNAKKEKRDGNLTGCRFSVARHEKRSPRVGGDFDFTDKVDDLKAKYPGINLDPYGFSAEQTVAFYMKLLAPMPRAEIEKLFAEHNVVDGSGFKGATSGTAPASDSADSIKY